MGYKQTVNPNLNVYGRAGYCLEFVDNVFDAPHGTPTAKRSWEVAVGRGVAHVGDRDLPNVSVPVYFSWKDLGHVVVYVPGRGFLSTNFKTNGTRWFGSIQEIERFLPGSYLGWSEEIDTKRVVIYESDQPTGDGRIPRSGTATVTTNVLNVRNDPSTDSGVQATYTRGGTFNYDSYIDANGYRWLSYLSYGGQRRYVAQGNASEQYVSGGV